MSAVEARQDPKRSASAVTRIADRGSRIAEQLGINSETLRVGVKRAEVDSGARPGVTSADAARIAELERKVRELRPANEILKTASAFFAAAELDRELK